MWVSVCLSCSLFFWPCLAMEISFFFLPGKPGNVLRILFVVISAGSNGRAFQSLLGPCCRQRSSTHILYSNQVPLVGKGQTGRPGIRSLMGQRQGRVLDAGWPRHRSYWHGQRYFLGNVGSEERIRWQACREKEGLKAEHATGVGIPATGPRQKSSEVVAIVPLRHQLWCIAWGWNTWFKGAGASHTNLPL